MRFFQWLWALFTRAEQPKPERVVTKERGEFLSDDERKMCGDETCPDCGTVDKFIGGPTAGLAANFYCGNSACGSRFNAIFPFGVERISDKSPLASPAEAAFPESAGAYRG